MLLVLMGTLAKVSAQLIERIGARWDCTAATLVSATIVAVLVALAFAVIVTGSLIANLHILNDVDADDGRDHLPHQRRERRDHSNLLTRLRRIRRGGRRWRRDLHSRHWRRRQRLLGRLCLLRGRRF